MLIQDKIRKSFKQIYDFREPNSWAANLRQQRMNLFLKLIHSIPSKPTAVKILDVGGRVAFWRESDFLNQYPGKIEITVINIDSRFAEPDSPVIKFLVGDATNMKFFADQEFDLVFSNSVIEHVGDDTAQLQMANEVRRVGKSYFVQTPNFYFPIEPHFVLPLFHFLPSKLRIWTLLNIGSLRRGKRYTDKQEATTAVTSIRLMTKKQLLQLFPGANLWEEKIAGMTKSFVVYRQYQ